MRTMRCDQLEVIMSIISIWNCRRESNVIRSMNEIVIDQGIMKDPDLESATGVDFTFFYKKSMISQLLEGILMEHV